MSDEPTCGKGLAATTSLHRSIGALVGALAGVLERHMTALDLEDANSLREHSLYGALAREHRAAAAALEAIAAGMSGAHDLPMGSHDAAAMADPRTADAFERFVELEEELLRLLGGRLDDDRTMLAVMRDAGDWAS